MACHPMGHSDIGFWTTADRGIVHHGTHRQVSLVGNNGRVSTDIVGGVRSVSHEDTGATTYSDWGGGELLGLRCGDTERE